MLHLSTM